MTTIAAGSPTLGLFSAGGAMPRIETRAQRKAKAAFTTPPTTPPWKEGNTKAPATKAAAIVAMRSIIDKPVTTGTDPLPVDVRTSFTAYRALERLQILAEQAAKDTTGSAERAQLQTAFGRGLAELKSFLTSAKTEKLDLSFARASRQVNTVPIASTPSLSATTITGKGLVKQRIDPLTGVKGDEVLRIRLSQGTGPGDTVTVDLSNGPRPPTLDGIADTVNAAIAAIPKRDASGAVVNDANGKPVPRWQVKLEPAKDGEKWGLSLKRAGFETISIDQVGAGDAVMVASGLTEGKAATDTRLVRFDDPAGTMTRRTLGQFGAVDDDATERSKMAADADKTGKTKARTVAAATAANGIATDAQGFSYVVGTSAGTLGGNLAHGGDDMILTKVNSEGAVVWQRNLGATGSAQGAAVTIGRDGGIVVAGTVKGSFDGQNTDGDLLVARYDALGNETFSAVARSVGAQSASAVTVTADGGIVVGGDDGKDAILARFDATGRFVERRTIDSGGTDRIKALATAPDGSVLALTSEGGTARLRRIDAAAIATDTATLTLGRAEARALAIAEDGSVAVAGVSEAALNGGQANARGGGSDAFVTRIDAGLAGALTTYIGTAASEQADSVGFLGGDIYVGGRTTGAFGGSRTGEVDGFVARIGGASGAVESVQQYGTHAASVQPVRISAVKGGNSVLGALGLHRGTLTPTDSVALEAQTGIRTGDEFSVRVNGGALRKVTIAEGETLTTLSDKVRRLLGNQAGSVTNPTKGTGRMLSIAAKPGQRIELVAGGAGKDALAKLGIEPQRISAPPPVADGAPKVRPGGAFGLDLTDALRIDGKADAGIALARVKQALSFSQSAYRSLYWDDAKAAQADPKAKGKTGGSTAIEQAQLANYQAALKRLGVPSTGMGIGL